MCQFPRPDLLVKTLFPFEVVHNTTYYINASCVVVDQLGDVYIRKNSPLRVSPVRQWERQYLLTYDTGGFHLLLTVPQNWRMEKFFINDKDRSSYLPVATILITQTEEVEEEE